MAFTGIHCLAYVQISQARALLVLIFKVLNNPTSQLPVVFKPVSLSQKTSVPLPSFPSGTQIYFLI